MGIENKKDIRRILALALWVLMLTGFGVLLKQYQ